MSKFRLYYFSTNSLKFVEARWAKTRFAAITLLVGVVVATTVFEVNQYLEDFLGLGMGRASVLSSENSVLRQQLSVLSGRLSGLERQLASLNDRGNEIRVFVDLPKIDEDTRLAGAGGTDDRVEYGVPSDVNELLRELHGMSARAERELLLQSKSYEEVVDRYDENKTRFAHLPAIKPMVGYYSVHGFGARLHPILRIVKPHEGMDIANDVGTPVHATADGTIEYAGRTGGGYGVMVEIAHGYGYTTAFAHLSKVLVKEGQRVKRGDLIALSGRTGLVSGPHLHYEVRLNGIRQNPIDYFFDDINYLEYRDQSLVLD
ncbi:MAG: peptidoglycan DD-metalloendopeptidase family protein [Ignavibacteriales bacterium]|nr:peptidoglycan DD-metalloendopeptidase family protein [Ignavibacteriales bacterium]